MLRIEWPVLSKMVDDVELFSYERCGFFLGFERNGDSIVTGALPVVNSRQGDRDTNYEITTEAYQCAEGMADAEGLKLLGVYHSHPNYPAIPSEYDQEMAQPDFFYLIISVKNKKMVEIRSWQMNSSNQLQELQFDFIRSSRKYYFMPLPNFMESPSHSLISANKIF